MRLCGTRAKAQAECDRANEPLDEKRILALAALDYHMKQATPDIRPGDIRRHPKGHLETVNASPFVGNFVQMDTGTHLRWLTAKWVAKNMPLVERGGVRVNDVWRDGLDHYHVDGLTGNFAGVDTEDGWTTMPIEDLARCVLVERDGVNVLDMPPEAA